MKKKILIILPIIVLAGLLLSYKTILFYYNFRTVDKAITPKINICLKQHQNLFINSLVPGKNSLEKPTFPNGEKKALEIIGSIDLQKIVIDEDILLGDILIKYCNSYNLSAFFKLDQQRVSCRKIFEQYNFYRALSMAIKKYKWSKEIKQEAQASIYNFVDYMSKNQTALTNLLVSLSLLKLMAEEGLIDKKHHQLIQKLHLNAERDSLRLRGTYRKLMAADQSITCENFKKYKLFEKEITASVSEGISAALAAIRN